MKLSPSSEAASCVATQEFINILWNAKVHYRVHKSPPLVHVMIQINPVHTISSSLSNSHLIIILGLSSGLFPSGFPNKILYVFLFCSS
jgi:hypothetical protein